MGQDPFDLTDLRVDPGKCKLIRPRKWQRHYVRFPWEWVERLRPVKRVSAYRLALLLVYEHWRQAAGRSCCRMPFGMKEEGYLAGPNGPLWRNWKGKGWSRWKDTPASRPALSCVIFRASEHAHDRSQAHAHDRAQDGSQT